MNSPAPPESHRRSFRLLGWLTLPVLALATTVQVTGVGIDILAVAVAGLVLLGLERSLGDWLGEWFGPVAAALIFVAAAAALSWYFLSDSLGRSQTERFFVEAERRGYSTVYYQTARSSADQPVPAADSSGTATLVATGGKRVGSTTSRTPSMAPPGAHTTPATPPKDATSAPEKASAVPQATTGEAGRHASDAPVKTSLLSFLRRSSSPAELIATGIAVSVSPSRISAARQTVITATVRAAGVPVTSGTVEFMVNGLGAGRVAVNGDGVASTTFLTHIPGTYEVRVRFSGTSTHASCRSEPVLLKVSPSR